MGPFNLTADCFSAARPLLETVLQGEMELAGEEESMDVIELDLMMNLIMDGGGGEERADFDDWERLPACLTTRFIRR